MVTDHSVFQCTRFRRQAGNLMLAVILLLPAALAQSQTADPWEKTNRSFFQFNEFFDGLIVRPVATVYSTVTPRFVQQGVSNFFSNIEDVQVAINDLLQFKLMEAASDCGRILLNSTIGIGGLIDVATPLGLEKNEEDFGQTFGVWGIPPGPFIIIPTYGASNLRDSVGWLLSFAFNPFFYTDSDASVPLYLLERTNTRAGLLVFDELIFGDEYIFVREAYGQRREYLINDGVVEDEFGEF